MLDVLRGVRRAIAVGHFNYARFDVDDYMKLDRIEHGDISWIVPGKVRSRYLDQPHPRTVEPVWGRLVVHSNFDYFFSKLKYVETRGRSLQ